MNLEHVIQSEVRKRKMNVNISVNMESRKMILMNLFARRDRDTDIENRLVEANRGGGGYK